MEKNVSCVVCAEKKKITTNIGGYGNYFRAKANANEQFFPFRKFGLSVFSYAVLRSKGEYSNETSFVAHLNICYLLIRKKNVCPMGMQLNGDEHVSSWTLHSAT